MTESPLALIKQGIINKDLSLILQGYNFLTGENLVIKPKFSYKCTNCNHSFESKKERKGCPKCRKRKLIICPHCKKRQDDKTILKSVELTSDITDQFRTQIRDSKQSRRRDDETTYAKPEPLNIQENTFHDDENLHQEDAKENLKLYNTKRVPRNRPAAKKVKVTCVGCNINYSVFPNQCSSFGERTTITDNYLCDRCIGSKR